ncbi:TPA: hypothetical protein NU657_004837 [Citrobacter freundii]|nr:hypothetical protein [Citrobacter freundii]
MSLQQSHENLEFLKGAVWCAAKLVQEIGDSKGAAILITNLPVGIFPQCSERDLFVLRQYVRKDLPLGIDTEYSDIRPVLIDYLGEPVDLPECELDNYEPAPGEMLRWGVTGDLSSGTRCVLVDNLAYLAEAIGISNALRQQAAESIQRTL